MQVLNKTGQKVAGVFEIWIEGYSMTGDSSKASLLAVVEAETFAEACNIYANANPKFKQLFDDQSLRHWGCDLFDNEEAARAGFRMIGVDINAKGGSR